MDVDCREIELHWQRDTADSLITSLIKRTLIRNVASRFVKSFNFVQYPWIMMSEKWRPCLVQIFIAVTNGGFRLCWLVAGGGVGQSEGMQTKYWHTSYMYLKNTVLHNIYGGCWETSLWTGSTVPLIPMFSRIWLLLLCRDIAVIFLLEFEGSM